MEIKLQRNALSVIEAPISDENDKDLEVENSQWDVSDLGKICGFCLYHVMKNNGLMLTMTTLERPHSKLCQLSWPNLVFY